MKNVITFLNTLIFCIVACAVAVSLMILTLTEQGQAYVFLIITVVFGFVWVIFYCLYKIIEKEKPGDKAPYPIAIAYCPDYYTRDGNICRNDFSVEDPYTNRPTTFSYTSGTGSVEITTSMSVKENENVNALCSNLLKVSNAPWVNLRARCGDAETWLPGSATQ